jgi:hypothetical protein
MTIPSRRHHPQVIRAKEMARAAGLDPECRDSRRSFMAAAFDEHFEREAVDNIYWDFYTADRWETPHRDGECSFSYGRCKSGQRWFWHVHGWAWGHQKTGEDYLEEYGWADTEDQALLDGTAAIKRLAAGRRVIARYFHQIASGKLKEFNTEKRKARPPSDATDSKCIEYLYGWHCRYQIIKRTARRIYYLKQGERIDKHGEPTGEFEYPHWERDYSRIGFVDRQKLEAAGEVHYLYPSLQASLAKYYREDQPPLDLRKLKAEMAAAHPDRGGSSAAFIAARQAYVAARRNLRDDGGRS